MGTFIYDGAMIEFEDRLLTHLQIVIMQKFRRQESFAMSWLDALAVGDGRSSIWLTPQTPLFFKFAGSRVPDIDKDWLAALGDSAGSSRGLVVVDDQGRPARAEGAHRKA